MWPALKNYIRIHVGFDIFKLLSYTQLIWLFITLFLLKRIILNIALKWNLTLFYIWDLDR